MPSAVPESEAHADLIAYVGNGASGDIHVLRLSPADGSLALLQLQPLPDLRDFGRSLPLALSPGCDFLYAVSRGTPRGVATFRIDRRSGELTPIGHAPLQESLAYIHTDRRGQFLFGASYDGSLVTLAPISPDGIAQAVVQRVPTASHAHAILSDAANRHVLASSLGGDVLYRFDFDPMQGQLTDPQLTALPAGTGPRHFVFAPTGRSLYVLGELDASVTMFDYDAGSGRLTQKQSVTARPSDFTGTVSASDIHLTPDGRFLYAAERASSTLACFAVDPASGSLRALRHTSTETRPRGFGIDPTGRFLLAAGQSSNHVTAYAIDSQTGALRETDRLTVGDGPDWVELIALTS